MCPCVRLSVSHTGLDWIISDLNTPSQGSDTIRYTLLYIDRGVYMGKYTPRAPEGYILKNQPTCKDGGLLLNMAQTSEWNEQVRAILRSNPTSAHGG